MVQKFLESKTPPLCDNCNGITKIATIAFGQAMPTEIMNEAYGWSEQADLFIVLGSSLVVEPAASLPRVAKRNGAKLVIINRDQTPQDTIADSVLHESIGDTLTLISNAIARTGAK